MGTGLRGQHLGQAVQVDPYQADAVISPIIHATILKKGLLSFLTADHLRLRKSKRAHSDNLVRGTQISPGQLSR